MAEAVAILYNPDVEVTGLSDRGTSEPPAVSKARHRPAPPAAEQRQRELGVSGSKPRKVRQRAVAAKVRPMPRRARAEQDAQASVYARRTSNDASHRGREEKKAAIARKTTVLRRN